MACRPGLPNWPALTSSGCVTLGTLYGAGPRAEEWTSEDLVASWTTGPWFARAPALRQQRGGRAYVLVGRCGDGSGEASA